MAGSFTFNSFDEGRVMLSRRTAGRLRLVCCIDGCGKRVLWGRDDGEPSSRRNFDTVWNAGVPCTVECEWVEPTSFYRSAFGQTHWVGDELELTVLS